MDELGVVKRKSRKLDGELHAEQQLGQFLNNPVILMLNLTFTIEIYGLWTDRALSFFRLIGTKVESSVKKCLDIDIRRECLIMYLGEDASCLIKEYQADQGEEAEREFNWTLDISIVIDGVEVLNELPSVACACAMMFGLIYALN